MALLPPWVRRGLGQWGEGDTVSKTVTSKLSAGIFSWRASQIIESRFGWQCLNVQCGKKVLRTPAFNHLTFIGGCQAVICGGLRCLGTWRKTNLTPTSIISESANQYFTFQTLSRGGMLPAVGRVVPCSLCFYRPLIFYISDGFVDMAYWDCKCNKTQYLEENHSR